MKEKLEDLKIRIFTLKMFLFIIILRIFLRVSVFKNLENLEIVKKELSDC